MIESIARKLTLRLCKGLSLSLEQYDAVQYGIDILLYTVISTCGLLMIGVCFHQFENACLIICTFYTNQTTGGGHHANSHVKCFCLMASFLTLGLFLCCIPFSPWLSLIIALGALMLLFAFPFVLHPNKQYLHQDMPRLARQSRLVIVLQGVLVLVCYIVKIQWLQAFSIGLAFSALSRVAAKLFHHSDILSTENKL